MVKTRRIILEVRIAYEMQRLKLKYFGDHSLEMAIPAPIPPTYQGLSGEEAAEAEEDFYYKWLYNNIVREKLDATADSHSDTEGMKSTVEWKESLLDEVTKEETELKLVLKGLDMIRKKRVDSKSNKALPASGTTGSGEVAEDKKRRIKPSGELGMKVAEGRSAAVDDLKEVDERARIARLIKGIWLDIEEERSELKKANVELEKELVRSRTDIWKEIRQLKASHAVADNYVDEEDEEEAETMGIMDGLDGVSCQTVFDNQRDDVELPGDSSRSREDDVLMCNQEFTEQFDKIKEANKSREDQYVKAHFRLEELTQAVFALALQVEEKDSEIKKGLKELAESFGFNDEVTGMEDVNSVHISYTSDSEEEVLMWEDVTPLLSNTTSDSQEKFFPAVPKHNLLGAAMSHHPSTYTIMDGERLDDSNHHLKRENFGEPGSRRWLYNNVTMEGFGATSDLYSDVEESVNVKSEGEDEVVLVQFPDFLGPRSKVIKNESLLDTIAREGVELEIVMKDHDINRNKRANSRSKKVQKSLAKRPMTGVGASKKRGVDGEDRPVLSRDSEMAMEDVPIGTTSSKLALKFLKKKAGKGGSASGTTVCGEVEGNVKKRRVDPPAKVIGVKVVENRAAKEDDLRAMEYRLRLAALKGVEELKTPLSWG
ncbi:hypothetical protein GIB67_037940 [Kingdonia uniflora]|uniref:Uncharacterized protein n=1 Tax=Kingdonia uniflora TaxID=39325 RepID=A0A7J7LHB5_9MAGN|nr:hypothetical protein GIB67_037940 [Kingdonia uniflora]